jgi:serine protease Do
MILAAIVCLLMFAADSKSEKVTIRGGAAVEAPMVKRNEDAVVLDLGFDLLRVPAGEVMKVSKDDEPADAGIKAEGDHLYHVSSAKRMSIVKASELCAPAVVVVKTPRGLGAGFFVNKDGYLITNFHVIKGEKTISVTRFLREAKTLRRIIHKDVEIVATAPFHDLAVLKVKEELENIMFVPFEGTDEVDLGETVFAIGNPMGLERTVTKGVISQSARNFRGVLYLQVDAPVNPGNSGGPLFNERGQVIGIINMGVPTMEGLNFAIPAMRAKYMLDHLDAYTFDESNPESGFVYPDPPRKPSKDIEKKKENSEDNKKK